ncbi:MAG: cache domain-containing protein [Symbiopectobacterium sp.]
MLKNALQNNPNFLPMSLAWEPNAYDGNDAQFAGQPENDPNGRYVRYVDRDTAGNVVLYNLTDYETPGSGDYYLLPRKMKQEVILEPYRYPYNGVEVLLISIAVPIVVDGTFLGSVTADFSLDRLQQLHWIDYNNSSMPSNPIKERATLNCYCSPAPISPTPTRRR